MLKTGSLWKHSGFLKLWLGQTVSLFGSAITTFALPLIALQYLHATPVQMGLLIALGQLAPLLVGLFIGAWVDRVRRRPLLIAADIGRCLLIGLIPLAYLFHLLTLELLCILSLFIGILSVIFTIAANSYVPTLIARERLIEGNSKLQLSQSITRILGPNLAASLVSLIGAPLAILGDLCSFLISACCIWLIRVPEKVVATSSTSQHFWQDIVVGLRFVAQHPHLRALAGCNATANLFWSAQTALFLFYLTNELALEAWQLGIIIAVGNTGLLLGTFLAKPVARRLGVGKTLIGAPIISILGVLIIPIVMEGWEIGPLIVIAAQFLILCPLMIYEIHQVSLRQSCTPETMQGRVNATMYSINWTTTPLGALVGGWLGEIIGVRLTLFLVPVGLLLALPWLWFSPIRNSPAD